MSTVHSNNANVSMKRTYTRAERKNIHFPNKYSSCCVKSCPHYNKPSSLVLYPMPTNVMIKESWCKAFNIPKNLADDPNSRVCSLHFRSRSGGPPPIPPPSKPTARPPKSTAPPPKPIAPPPKTTAPPPKPKGLSNHVITVIINNNNYKVVESATALPSLNPPIPPDISQELSTRQNNLEKVKFLKEAISKIENLETDKLNPETTNSEKDADSLVSEQMVLEPDFSEIIEPSPDVSVKQVSDQEADAISFEPEVILDSSNDCIEDKNEEPVLELECEDQQLSETQLDFYMKEMVEFLSANQTVYRLAQTSSAPKFPSIKSSEVDLKANNSVDNNVLTYMDGGVLPTSSALAPTTKLFPNSFLVSPFSKVETSKAHSPSFVPILPSNSSVTDITKKYSIVHDEMGKILSQNISSNLSVNGNVIFSKDLNINQSSNFPVASGTMIPVGTNPVLSNTSLPFVPNINMANFDWNNSNQVSQSQCSVLKNNQGPALSTTVRPKMHILTPISSVSQLKTMNSQPLNVISSQGNIPFILSPFVSSSKSLPSNVVFSFAPLTNSSEMKTVFSSAPMPPISSGVNNLNGPFKPGTISSQPGFPVPQSTVYQIVNLPEAPKPMTLTNNLEQGGPVSFKPSDSTYQKAKHQEGDVVPLHGESIPSPASKSDNLLESAGPSIQIVDVKGAKEGGAGEFFGESVSSIPSDNSKANPSDQPLETLSDSDGVGTEDFVNFDESSDDDESRLNTISYESKKGKSEVTQMHAIYIIQEDVPVILCKPGTMYLCPGDRTLFSIPRGEAKNRLSDSDDLRRKLKNAEFVTEAIPWMLKKKYLPSVPPCEKCGESILMLEKTNWLKFKEGYCYTCYNVSCHEKTPVKRCAFFDRFKKFSTECLLLLTYHWACMSPLQEIELDLDLDLEDVWSYFRALQHLCWIDNHKKLKLGSAYGNYVEAAVVKLGKYFILGAYDRKTKFVRMDVLSLEEARKSMTTVKLLMDWLNPNSFLVCQKAIPKGLLRGIKTEVADPSVTDIRSTLPHTLNITLYLKRTLESMFGNYYHHTQTREFLGKMLAERQWREKSYRFGIEGAFWGILEVITEQNPSIGETTATIGIPSQKKNPYQPIDINNVCQLRWGPTFTERCTAIPSTYPSDSLPSWKETEPVKIQTYEKTRRPFTSSKSKGSVLSAKEKLDFKEKFQEVVSTASPSMKASPSMEQKDPFGSYELIKDKKSPFITLLQDLQEIRGSNNSLNFDAILSIKIQHLRRPKEVINYRRTAIELGTALRKEGFHSHPVKWLVKKNFINYVSKCYVCDSTAYLRDNNKFPDGCSWSCQNKECKFENIFRRPKFFARFPHQSMNHLLALVFHWIAQTKIDNILSDTSIDRQKIAHTWKAFQLKCNQTLHRENIKLGGPSHLVELAIVEHGKKYILGVYDRKSNLTAMKAYNKDHLTEEALFSFIETWLRPGTTVIVNARPTFPLPRNYYLKLASDRLLADYTVSYNVHLITRYLKTHLKNMFGKLNPMAVTPLFAQLYLDELMWRERFDTQPITSFSKLMQEIFIDEGIEKSLACEKLEEIIEDEHKEIPSLPVKLKEVRIVLKRIPQTVLKYYNCLDLASPQSSSVVKASSQNETTASKLETVIEVENDVEVEKDEELESIIDVENDPESSTSSPETDFPNLETTSLSDLPLTHAVFSEEVIATPSDPVFNRKKQVYQNDNDNSDEDYIADDSESEDDEEEEEEENSSADEFNPINMFRNFKWKSVRRRGTHSKGKTYSTYLKPDKSINLADTLDNFLFSDSSRNSNSTQSVQPLVINVCRKNKEPMFFIKSDSSATVSAAENSVDSNDGYVSESHPSSEFSLAESSVNLDIEPSVNTEHCINIKPCINIKSSLNIEPVVETIMAETKLQIPEKERKPISKLKRRLEEGLECVECGETLGFAMEHFMKKYQCSDCKNYVYTTCCSNSFFEHRGSLLFGKRMPKKLKRNFGLHKNASLPQPWFCKCGFTSSFGNKLASHLLKCPKSSGCVTTKK